MSATTILNRFLDPITQLLPPETAQQLVDLHLDSESQARIDELADKANYGRLSDQERAEYEEILDGLDLIAILKAKARAAIRRRDG